MSNSFETFPIHIMIKPEGLDLFPDYITSQIELIDTSYSLERMHNIRTVLTPNEVELIYPGSAAPDDLKTHLSNNPTHSFFIHGKELVYSAVKSMKGKYGNPVGIRGQLSEASTKINQPMEKWKNFVHSSDDKLEAHGICFHFNTDVSICQNCAARSLCYGAKGSDMQVNFEKK